jgi:hypothetical protein
MDIRDCEPGISYACRFRTTTFLDTKGTPVQAQLTQGEAHPGAPGVYESVGIIRTRDLANCRVLLVDTVSEHTFVVSTQDIWDIDVIEWVDKL